MNSWEELERSLACELELAAVQSVSRANYDSSRIEVMIKKYNALKLYINSEDHPPPHMHVYLNDDLLARICLKTCTGLDGVNLKRKGEQGVILKWCKLLNKKEVLELWDEIQNKTPLTQEEIDKKLKPQT